MTDYRESFSRIKERCLRGTAEDIDVVIALLDDHVDLPTTKAIDLYLGYVENSEGRARLAHYLLQGTQLQRNYITLYFARRNEWAPVNDAYAKGLVDWKQAYSR